MNLKNENYFVHDTAVIDSKVKIGQNSKIWHFSHILNNVIIGKNCSLGQNTMVGPNVRIGNNCKIQNNVSIYEGVEIEDDVFLGPSCVFTNVINPRSAIERKNQFQKTIVKKGVTIGANSTIVCGITLNNYCFIGAGAVVTKNIPKYALVVGNPARRIGWMSKQGYRLNDNLECEVSGEKYKRISEDEIAKL